MVPLDAFATGKSLKLIGDEYPIESILYTGDEKAHHLLQLTVSHQLVGMNTVFCQLVQALQ